MKKTSDNSNDMRSLLKKMRIANSNTHDAFSNLENSLTEVTKKTLSFNDTIKMMRKLRVLNEADENVGDSDDGVEVAEEPKVRVNKKNVYDQQREEDRFNAFLNKSLNVNTEFIELEIYDDLIFWGGTVDGMLQFIFKVTPTENTSGVEFNYLDSFNTENPDNNMLTELIESYYDSFYKYWNENMLTLK